MGAIEYAYFNPEHPDTQKWEASLAQFAEDHEQTFKRVDFTIPLRAKSCYLIVLGGDGALNLAISKVFTGNLEERCHVLYYPCGTGNDFARATNLLAWTPRDFIEAMVMGDCQRVFIARCNHSYFINMATVGQFAEITPQVDPEIKNMLGRWSYYLKGLQKLGETQSYPFSISIDQGSEIEVDALGFFIGNAPFAGGGIQVTPGADPARPGLSLLIVKDAPLTELIALALELQKESPDLAAFKVHHQKFNTLDFKTNRDVAINFDGESHQIKQAHISQNQSTISIVMPSKDAPDVKSS